MFTSNDVQYVMLYLHSLHRIFGRGFETKNSELNYNIKNPFVILKCKKWFNNAVLNSVLWNKNCYGFLKDEN